MKVSVAVTVGGRGVFVSGTEDGVAVASSTVSGVGDAWTSVGSAVEDRLQPDKKTTTKNTGRK